MLYRFAARLMREESGQDVIEYGLLIGAITATAVVAITSMGGILHTFYTELQIGLEK